MSSILVTLFLAGCSISGMSYAVPNEVSSQPEVYFCPKDDCGKVLESYITRANYSVHCALYDLELRNVISALSRKSKDTDVKLVTDNDNNHSIKGAGIRFDDDGQLMHNKFCIIDDKTIVTGSFNPTDNDNYKNNNNLVIIHSVALSKNYEDEFDELWNGGFGKGSRVNHPVVNLNGIKIENYFCPEDRCAEKIISAIEGARSSIYFMSFSFTSEDIADSLIKRWDVEIRGLVDSGQSSNKYSQLGRMKGFGIDVKKDTGRYKLHHKVFIIDNQTVITGSFNPTLSADTKNDENILIMHDKKFAGFYLKEFDSLWQ